MFSNLKLAKEFGFHSIDEFLSSVSAYDLKLWRAYEYVDSGRYHEKLKKQNEIIKLKAMFPVKKING